MKKALIIPSLFLLLINFTDCTSPSEEIERAFKTVDKSITTSNQVLKDSIDILYASVQDAPSHYEGVIMKLNSLRLASKASTQYIESLQAELKELDPTGENTGIPGKLLINTAKGDSLRQSLLLVVQYAQSALYSEEKMDQLKKVAKTITEEPHGIAWSKGYFHDTPTVAARTILNKFIADTRTLTLFVLRDASEHLAGIRKV